MSSQELIDRIQQLVADFNQGNLESIRQHLAADFFTNAANEGEPSADEIYYQLAQALKAGLPDLNITIQELTAEGDQIKGQVTLTGTHSASLWGVPGSGNAISWTAPVTIRAVNGQLAINWDVGTPVAVGSLRQLGLVNPPEDMDKPSAHPVAMPEFVLRMVFTGQVANKPCSHLDGIQVTEPTTDVCEACVATGDAWPALRMCLVCGYVGCCDMSQNQHMKQHYEQTGHAVFRSINQAEGWIWCYEDNAFFGQHTLEQYQR